MNLSHLPLSEFQSQSGKQPPGTGSHGICKDFQSQSSKQSSTSYHIACAWCLVEQGEPLGSGSHGICEAHAEQIIQQYRARRRARNQ